MEWVCWTRKLFHPTFSFNRCPVIPTSAVKTRIPLSGLMTEVKVTVYLCMSSVQGWCEIKHASPNKCKIQASSHRAWKFGGINWWPFRDQTCKLLDLVLTTRWQQKRAGHINAVWYNSPAGNDVQFGLKLIKSRVHSHCAWAGQNNRNTCQYNPSCNWTKQLCHRLNVNALKRGGFTAAYFSHWAALSFSSFQPACSDVLVTC